jgi:hypothetical protein
MLLRGHGGVLCRRIKILCGRAKDAGLNRRDVLRG